MIPGERQMSTTMELIKPDHRARYIFASSYINPGDVVLDAICGIGYGSKLMAQLSNSNIIAFDRDKEAILFAKTYYSSLNITFLQSTYEEFRFPESSFDLITCFEAVEHLVSPQVLLLKLNLFLKPQGLMLISTPNESVMSWSEEKFPEHFQHYRKEEFEQMLIEAGFKVDSWHCQHDKYSFSIDDGWDGKFMIAVCRKT